MKKTKNPLESFDPNGNYTGKYIIREGIIADTQPEQDADDL